MASFFLIFICFGLGMFFRRTRIFPETTPIVLNRFAIYISLPALTLAQLHRLELGSDIVFPVSMAWIHFLLGLAFFWGIGTALKLPRRTIGALILTGSLGNTSFVGFPLLDALFGPQSLGTGILVDQPGTFLVTGTLGVAVAALLSGSEISPLFVAKRIFTFPPFLAVLVAVLTKSFTYPPAILTLCERLGATLIPLSLVSVGASLRFHPEPIRRNLKSLSLGLVFKLLLAPLFFIALYVGVFHRHGETARIVLLESAMAPMITAGILAHEYGLDPELGNLMVGIGIPLSLATVPIWAWVLARFV
jgi:predicted permease